MQNIYFRHCLCGRGEERCVSLCVCVCVSVGVGVRMVVVVVFFLPLCGSQWLRSGLQAWWQVLLLPHPPHRPGGGKSLLVISKICREPVAAPSLCHDSNSSENSSLRSSSVKRIVPACVAPGNVILSITFCVLRILSVFMFECVHMYGDV